MSEILCFFDGHLPDVTCNVVFVLLSKKFMKPAQKINSFIFSNFLWPGQSGQQAQAYGYYEVDHNKAAQGHGSQGAQGTTGTAATHGSHTAQGHGTSACGSNGGWASFFQWWLKPSTCSEAFTCICITTHAKLFQGNKNH